MTPRVKLIILAAAVAIGLGLLFTVATRALTTGQLNITTSDTGNYITLTRIDPNPGTIDTKNAHGKFSAQLATGTYTITVQNKSFSAQQVVTIKAGQTVTANVDLAKVGPVETVATVEATNLVADGSVLRYIDRDSNSLYEVNNLNQLHNLNASVPYSAIIWAGTAYGVARDSSGHFYSIQGASVTAIAIPFVPSELSTSYAVAPNKDVYLTDGSKIYRGAAGQNFQTILISSKQVSIKAASNTTVLIQESDPKNPKAAASLITIDHTGTSASVKGDAYDATFSPSGNQIVINGDSLSAVLDTKLKEVIRLPQNNVTTPVWTNDTTIIYAQQNKLWQFNTVNGQADVIADTDAAAITQQFVAADGSYVYLSTQNIADGLNQQLLRVGLKNQPVAQDVTVLGLILPATVDACRLSFINFTAPTVAIQGPTGGQAVCTQKTQQYLQTYHVGTAAVGISFSAN